MPTPKLFKKFSSKNNNLSRSGPALDEDVPQTADVTSDAPVSGYSDSLTEAWAVAHRELPQAHGTEKVLNKIGMSIPPAPIVKMCRYLSLGADL